MTYWKNTQVSSCSQFHIYEEKPLYSKMFENVLKFHEPGLAPVVDQTGAYHININGESVYTQRYFRTFGFYEGKASVQQVDGWFHILENGNRLYTENYQWTGNFQNGFCPVRGHQENYFHLNKDGKPAYSKKWSYVGDYRDGCSVVQNDEGLHSHIREDGSLLHNKWFLDLNVFHKGYAQAEDKQGSFHVDNNGEELYSARFSFVEPFYNGQARVKTKDGKWSIIDETGRPQTQLSNPSEVKQNLFSELSGDIVSYWKAFTLNAACKLEVFDFLPSTCKEISNSISISEEMSERLLRALWEMELVTYDFQTEIFSNQPKGNLLKVKGDSSLGHVAISFTTTHITPWQELTESLQIGRSSYLQKVKKDWFSEIESNSSLLGTFQKALQCYATKDYQNISQVINTENYQHIIDAAGGQGEILINLLKANSEIKGTLLERKDVVSLVTIPQELEGQMFVSPFDLFQGWPVKADVIILARVLHDWDDESCYKILEQAKKALLPEGKIYILEMPIKKEEPNGSLLDLNMLVVTSGKERTFDEYSKLFKNHSFSLKKGKQLTDVSCLFVAEKVS